MNVYITALLKILENPEIKGTHYTIAYYLLMHYDEIQNMTLSQLAQECFVSVSTLKRFFAIYDLHKFTIVKELLLAHQRVRIAQIEERRDNYRQDQIEATLHLLLSEEQCQRILDEKQLKTLIQRISLAHRLIFIGSDEMINALLRFQADMASMGKPVINSSVYPSGYISPETDDLVFLFSMTGRITQINQDLAQKIRGLQDRMISVGAKDFANGSFMHLYLPENVDDALTYMVMIYYFESIVYLYKETYYDSRQAL